MIKISDEHGYRIQMYFPEEKVHEGCPGRKPVPARQILDAVLWILTTGACAMGYVAAIVSKL